MADRPSKPRPKKAERRQRVVEHARVLFAKQGFAATTMEELAEAVGLTPSAMSRTFPDLAAVVQGVVDEFHARLFPDPSLLSLSALLAGIRADARVSSSPTRVVLRLLAEGDKECQAALAKALELCVESLAELVRREQQTGVFRRALDPRQAAWELLRSLVAWAQFDGIEPSEPTDKDQREQPPSGVECLLHGLLKMDV